MPPPFRRRTTKKKEPRLAPWPAAALEERIEEIMDRVQEAGHNRVGRVAALEEYLTLARAHEGATWFDAEAQSEDLADSYLAPGRVDDAVRTISDATRRGYAEGADVLCELAEKLMRSGHEPRARPLWQQARADYTDGWSWPTTRPTTTGGAPITASRSNRPGKPVSPDAPRHSVRPAAGHSLAWVRCAMGPGRSAGRPGAVLCRASAPARVFMPP